jgi:hypothetical protein
VKTRKIAHFAAGGKRKRQPFTMQKLITPGRYGNGLAPNA